MNSEVFGNRTLRVSILQIVIMPIAGISQFLTISLLANKYEGQALTDNMQILSFSTFFIFMDLGLIYNSFYNSSQIENLNSKKSIQLITTSLKMSCILAAIYSVIAIPIYIFGSKYLAIYFFINGLTLPGLTSLAILRGFGKDLSYLAIFHASWPLSLIFLIVFLSHKKDYIYSSIPLAYLPLVSSLIVGFIANWKIISICFQQKQNDYWNELQVNASNPVHALNLKSSLALLTSAASMQIDKLIVLQSNSFLQVSKSHYLYFGLIVTSCLTFLNSLATVSLGEKISTEKQSSESHRHVFRIGLLLSVALIVGIICNNVVSFINVKLSLALTVLLPLSIALYGKLFQIHTLLNAKKLLKQRSISNICQFTIISCYILLPQQMQTLEMLVLLICTAVVSNCTLSIYFLRNSKL